MTDFDALHDALPDSAHVCPEYDLNPEQCYRATACGECGVRRDEHADQPEQSPFPGLDITDHIFVE
jgi:hypothetical protein